MANIVGRGAAQRKKFALMWAIISAVLIAIAYAHGTAPVERALIAVPIALAAGSYLQAREMTCVVLCVMNAREVEDGGYARVDENETPIVRRQVMRILYRSALVGVVAATLLYKF